MSDDSEAQFFDEREDINRIISDSSTGDDLKTTRVLCVRLQRIVRQDSDLNYYSEIGMKRIKLESGAEGVAKISTLQSTYVEQTHDNAVHQAIDSDTWSSVAMKMRKRRRVDQEKNDKFASLAAKSIITQPELLSDQLAVPVPVTQDEQNREPSTLGVEEQSAIIVDPEAVAQPGRAVSLVPPTLVADQASALLEGIAAGFLDNTPNPQIMLPVAQLTLPQPDATGRDRDELTPLRRGSRLSANLMEAVPSAPDLNIPEDQLRRPSLTPAAADRNALLNEMSAQEGISISADKNAPPIDVPPLPMDEAASVHLRDNDVSVEAAIQGRVTGAPMDEEILQIPVEPLIDGAAPVSVRGNDVPLVQTLVDAGNQEQITDAPTDEVVGRSSQRASEIRPAFLTAVNVEAERSEQDTAAAIVGQPNMDGGADVQAGPRQKFPIIDNEICIKDYRIIEKEITLGTVYAKFSGMQLMRKLQLKTIMAPQSHRTQISGSISKLLSRQCITDVVPSSTTDIAALFEEDEESVPPVNDDQVRYREASMGIATGLAANQQEQSDQQLILRQDDPTVHPPVTEQAADFPQQRPEVGISTGISNIPVPDRSQQQFAMPQPPRDANDLLQPSSVQETLDVGSNALDAVTPMVVLTVPEQHRSTGQVTLDLGPNALDVVAPMIVQDIPDQQPSTVHGALELEPNGLDAVVPIIVQDFPDQQPSTVQGTLDLGPNAHDEVAPMIFQDVPDQLASTVQRTVGPNAVDVVAPMIVQDAPHQQTSTLSGPEIRGVDLPQEGTAEETAYDPDLQGASFQRIPLPASQWGKRDFVLSKLRQLWESQDEVTMKDIAGRGTKSDYLVLTKTLLQLSNVWLVRLRPSNGQILVSQFSDAEKALIKHCVY